MREVEATVPRDVDGAGVAAAVEAVIVGLELHVSLRGSLASYPGSLHWHVKRGRRRGTLEVTFAPGLGRLWLSVHAGREGDWVDEMLNALPGRLSAALGKTQSLPT